MDRSMLRTGDLVNPGYYTMLSRDIDGGDSVCDYLKSVPCLVLALGEAVWNEKRPRKRTKRVLLFEPVTCKVGCTDVRWVRRLQ